MSFRKFLLCIHLVAGLLAALLLLALGLSGAILVFENEIDASLNARLDRIQPAGERLPLNALVEKVEQAHPGAKVSMLVLPVEDDGTDRVMLRPAPDGAPAFLAVNPFTGEELGDLAGANHFTSKVHQFHTNLLLGAKGKLITSAGSILLLLLASTGLVLWWPRKIWKLRRGAPLSRMNFDLHNTIGLWSSVFLLIFGTTGLVIHWDNELARYVNRITRAPEAAPAPKRPAPPPRGFVPLSPDQAMNAALKAVPGAKVTTIMGLGMPGPVRVTMKYPEDATPAGRTNLTLDPVTGEVLSLETSRTGPWGVRIVKLWNREIHTGDIFGLPTRILACVVSLLLPLLAITGPCIWLSRLLKKRPAE